MSLDDDAILDELVARMHMRARIAFRGRLCEQWTIGGIAQGRLGFHLVTSGCSWLQLPDLPAPVELGPGALLVYRPSVDHLFSERPRINREADFGPGSGLQVGLLCGYFEGSAADAPVVNAVPAYLFWPRCEALPEPLARMVRTIMACAPDESAGGTLVLQRLCELMLFMLLREPQVLARDALGLLRAQRDPVLRRVFHAIHARPGRRWTLELLARNAGVSRSVLAEKFKQQAGIPAMRYLRQYRVQLGTRRQQEEGLTVQQVARTLGYRSAAAFRRAQRRD